MDLLVLLFIFIGIQKYIYIYILNAMINEKCWKNKHKKLSILFFDDMENIEDFDPKLRKIDKKFYKSININYIDISQ